MEETLFPYQPLIHSGDHAALRRAMKKAEAGEGLGIAFLGGSITEGYSSTTHEKCYAARVHAWWKENFPQSEIRYINAGIGGTGSQYGAARVEKDILSRNPDVIFVDGTYYMISTTMHFLPGGQILRSGDLLHWEHAAYVFDTLDGTDAQKLRNGKYIYGKGMWAASLRYHKGTFYVVFVCNDTQKTYLFRSEKIEGPWRKSEIEGFYHDCSLLFDDDDRIYVVYGHRSIYLTELNAELTGPKEGGLSRLLLKDSY